MRRWITVAAAAAMLLGACGGDAEPSGNGTTNAPPANTAQDEAAQASLRNGLAAASLYFLDGDTYSGFDVAAAAGIEPALTWVEGTEPAAGEIAIVSADGPDAHLVTQSESGTFFCGRNHDVGATSTATFGSGAAFADVDTAEECADPSF